MNQTNKTSLLMTFFFYLKIYYVIKNSYLYLRKIQISFYIKKNSDLHLRKIQIYFYVRKNSD